MTVNVESSTHSVTYLNSGGANFNIADEDNPVQLAINVSGSSNITFGNSNLLYAWSQNDGVINAYADTTINVNTSGTVSALLLPPSRRTQVRRIANSTVIRTSPTQLA